MKVSKTLIKDYGSFYTALFIVKDLTYGGLLELAREYNIPNDAHVYVRRTIYWFRFKVVFTYQKEIS